MRIRRRKTTYPPSEAERARTEAIAGLARTVERGTEIRRVTSSLREWREQNHIVAQLDRIFYGSSS